MHIDEDFTFPANYVIDSSPGWPELNEVVVRALEVKNPLENVTGGYLNLRFYPEEGAAWFGEFPMSGTNSRGAICSSPVADVVFIQSGWRTFRVNITEKSAHALDTYPVIQMKPDPYRKLIWLVGFGHVEAIDPAGNLAWKSNRFVLDDLRILEIKAESALIEGLDGWSIERRETSLEAGRIVDKLGYG